MTDDLRTKIAKTLHQMYHLSLDDVSWDDEPYMVQDDYLRDADVVIRVLGLRKEQDDQQRPIHSCATVRYRRYVTKWETDE